MNPIPPFQPGDLLIFNRKGLFDTIIKVKTWSQACHTEVYIGDGKTVASRNGKGVAVYALDLSGLYAVLRPQLPFDQDKAMANFYRNLNGHPYGWISLLSFCLIDIHDNGFFCSETSTLFYRGGGFEPFNKTIKAETVAPGDYLYVSYGVMLPVWQKE